MRFPHLGRLWPRLFTALVVAVFATIGAGRLFISTVRNEVTASPELTANPDDAPPPAAVAGRLDAEFVPEPVVVGRAPAPIAITVTVDHTAAVMPYLRNAGLDADEATRWAALLRQNAAVRKLEQGHSLTLYEDPDDGSLRELKYNVDDRVAVREINYGDDVLRASQEALKFVIRPVALSFRVSGNFAEAAERNALPPPIAATIENTFRDDHPLNTLPRGTAIKLIYQERVSRDGTVHSVTGLEAAQISFGDRTLNAFAFRDGNGEAHLYDADGDALGQQALRYPVAFKYISSGFSFHRYHPILHEYRPHLGVDLVARFGTPVKAIADGRVHVAGWCGELGRCVRIDHQGGVESIYGHLSAIAPGIDPGATVTMGELIGRVGTSGLSTGAHLHFAIEKDGQYVNPLTQSLGEHHHVSVRMVALFDRLKASYLTTLNRLPSFGGHFSVAHPNPQAVAAAGRPAPAVTPATSHRMRRHHRAAVEQVSDTQMSTSSGSASPESAAIDGRASVSR